MNTKSITIILLAIAVSFSLNVSASVRDINCDAGKTCHFKFPGLGYLASFELHGYCLQSDGVHINDESKIHINVDHISHVTCGASIHTTLGYRFKSCTNWWDTHVNLTGTLTCDKL